MLLSMRLFYLLNLLTFVAGLWSTTLFASPRTQIRPSPVKNPVKAEAEAERTDVLKEETTQISYPEKIGPPHSEAELPPPARRVIDVPQGLQLKDNSLSFTFDSGYFIDNEISKNILIFSYKRTLLRMDEAELLLGFGLSPQNISMMQFGQRWHWRTWTTDSGDEHPLYFNFNILNYIDSSQMLAGLINVNHFKLQLTFGLDQINLFHEDFSAEIGAAYGINGFSASASLNWSF